MAGEVTCSVCAGAGRIRLSEGEGAACDACDGEGVVDVAG